jgi:hypothetical protein
MSSSEKVTYEDARDHVDRIIREHPELTLKKVCDWIGKTKKTQYHYVWQVLDGSYGKSKRSPNIVKMIGKALQRKGYWYEVGNIPDNFEKVTD